MQIPSESFILNPLDGLISDDVYEALDKQNLLSEKGVRDYQIRRQFRSMRRCDVPAYEAIEQLRETYPYLQFDPFHVYTVDQHILFVVRNLRRFAYGKYSSEFAHAADIFQQIDHPEILYLAALFHDIAKGRQGDHSTLGAQDALDFCRQLPLSEEHRQRVAWLVEQHLVMSQTAQRRDISDPETIKGFCEVVGNQARLDYLYLVTIADIAATSSKLWNNWHTRGLSTPVLSY